MAKFGRKSGSKSTPFAVLYLPDFSLDVQSSEYGDVDVPGHGLGATSNDVFAQAMVVGAPRARSARAGGCHLARITGTAQILNDIEGAALANRKFRMSSLAAGLTRARVTQLLDLTLLAPDFQEQILFAESVDGIESIAEQQIRRNLHQLPARLLLVQRRPPGLPPKRPAAGRPRGGS